MNGGSQVHVVRGSPVHVMPGVASARDSAYRHILRDRRGVSWHAVELLAACVAIILCYFAWQAWRFEAMWCTREPPVLFLGIQWGFWWRAWLSLYGTLRGRRGSLDVLHEIARHVLRHAWLSFYATLRGRRDSLMG